MMLEERRMEMKLSYIKTIVGIILGGVVVYGVCGCSQLKGNYTTQTDKRLLNTQENIQTKTLEIWWWGNQTRNEITQKVLSMYSDKHTDTDFSVQFSVWSDYWNKLATSAAGHTLPDIVQMDHRYLNLYATHNLLVDLNPYIESGKLECSNINESVIDAGKIEGSTYAIVCGVNAPALLYNKTLLEEHNIQIHDYMTIDEFVRIAKEVYEKTGYKTNMAYSNEELISEYLLRDEGYVYYGEEGTTISSSKEIEPFFRLYEQGQQEGWLIGTDIFSNRTIGSIEQDPLVYGTTPDTLSWCSFVYSNQSVAYQDAAPEGVEIGITTCPANHPEKANFLKPSVFWAITADCDNVEAAVDVINYIVNDVECNKVLLGERGIPASSKVSEAISKHMNPVDQKVANYINQTVTPRCSKINPSPVENNDVIIKKMKYLVQQVSHGTITAKEAADILYKEYEKIEIEMKEK